MVSHADELRSISTDLERATSKFKNSKTFERITALEEAVDRAAKSFGGSWLGYHANVYHRGLTPSPPGAHFSQEWGLGGEAWLGLSSTGDWVEYDPGWVKEQIAEWTGDSDFSVPQDKALELIELFEQKKHDVISILNLREYRNDPLLKKQLQEAEGQAALKAGQIIQRIRPHGQVMTRDTTALGQGIKTPPHVEMWAQALVMRQGVVLAESLSRIAANCASHIARSFESEAHVRAVDGKHVFIGHGRSAAWLELKAFISDRLKLQWDEFNRVPVAGVANSERLEEMLGDACIAFMVMTGEDEQRDGKVQARMNVVHEAGLFQGRLGFRRAIILLEEGCEEFSNIHGLGQIRFPRGRIAACFDEVRRVLERETIITASPR